MMRGLFGGLVLGVLAGCGAPPGAGGINDPLEPVNRAVHGVNVALDRVAVRPAGMAYGSVVPGPLRRGVDRVASNLGLPGAVVNSVLQARPEPAVRNTFRFVLNTTLGVGGLFDPAASFGMAEAETDFGETLHVWGVGEGAYLELPLFGPSTVRDATGRVVDIVLDPVGTALNDPEVNYATGATAAELLGDRYQYRDVIDPLLYDSADGYAAARLAYLQNRRFQLGQEASDADFIDPYEDPYGDR